jgi:hypothetical protein
MARLVDAALRDIESDDGIQAGELIQIIGTLAIDDDRRIPTSRILDASRQAARLGQT